MGEATDATMRSIELFDHPEHWGRIDDDIVIFKPHETRDQDGNIVKVDEKRLKRIADRINRNYEENGCPLKFYEGHTKDPKKFAQKDQPPILAYGVGVYVGRWGPKKKIGLLVKKTYCRKDSVDRYEGLPERSPEFYEQTDEMRGIALLKTDPRLDMGFTIYRRSDGVLCYQRGIENMADDPTKLPPNKNAPPPKPGPGMPGEGEDEVPPEEQQKYMKYMKACSPALYGLHEHLTGGKKISEYGMGGEREEGPVPPDVPPRKEEEEATKMGRDAMSLHYARIEREHKERLAVMEKSVKAHTDALDRQKRLLAYERELNVLKDAGYAFDMDEELEECKDKDEKAFKAHTQKIVRRYGRDATKLPVVRTDWDVANPTGDPNVITEEHQVAALKYQRANAVEWDDAVEKTRGAVARR
jgi:hypothetical protein